MAQAKKKLMARLRASRQRDGLVRVEVWVPRAEVAALRAYVRKLTNTVTASPDSAIRHLSDRREL
jgi:vacuolar-type H+-ATPase subunit I/STV1